MQSDSVAGGNERAGDDVVAIYQAAGYRPRIPSMSAGGAAMKATMKQKVAASRQGILSTPNQPMSMRLLVDQTHWQKLSQLPNNPFGLPTGGFSQRISRGCRTCSQPIQRAKPISPHGYFSAMSKPERRIS